VPLRPTQAQAHLDSRGLRSGSKPRVGQSQRANQASAGPRTWQGRGRGGRRGGRRGRGRGFAGARRGAVAGQHRYGRVARQVPGAQAQPGRGEPGAAGQHVDLVECQRAEVVQRQAAGADAVRLPGPAQTRTSSQARCGTVAEADMRCLYPNVEVMGREDPDEKDLATASGHMGPGFPTNRTCLDENRLASTL